MPQYILTEALLCIFLLPVTAIQKTNLCITRLVKEQSLLIKYSILNLLYSINFAGVAGLEPTPGDFGGRYANTITTNSYLRRRKESNLRLWIFSPTRASF